MRLPSQLVAPLLALVAIGCATPLREPPPPLTAEPGTRLRDISIEKARALWQQRPDLPAVREAVQIWLRLAAQPAQAPDDQLTALTRASQAQAWLADHEQETGVRETAADGAVHAAQHCRERFPEQPVCQFWLAVGLGVQARERAALAKKAMPMMVEILTQVAAADPQIERGGPDRVLALVYLRAPGWPIGPGDEELGLEHAKNAVAIDPDYPPNLLTLGEAWAENGDDQASRAAYQDARQAAERMREQRHPDAPEWLAQAERALAKLSRRA
ncbi:MAG: hypothetical protein JSV80_00700 [Acidobacteriota bacterium]|nr:MAG: hypothetical protein JSV80_00700 [Acidobacteriota bacterium]